MRGGCVNVRGTGVPKHISSLAHRAAGVDEVVDHDACLVLDITHNGQGLNLIARLSEPTLVEKRDLSVQVVELAQVLHPFVCKPNPTGVGRHDYEITLDARGDEVGEQGQ